MEIKRPNHQKLWDYNVRSRNSYYTIILTHTIIFWNLVKNSYVDIFSNGVFSMLRECDEQHYCMPVFAQKLNLKTCFKFSRSTYDHYRNRVKYMGFWLLNFWEFLANNGSNHPDVHNMSHWLMTNLKMWNILKKVY